jgi:hypothetical protein
LAKAEQSLDHASESLDANAMPAAQTNELAALNDLANARKMFQKVVSDHPEEFQREKEPEQVADAAQRLGQMAEFRDESKAAQDFVRKTLEAQQKLDHATAASQRNSYPRLASQERELERSLEEFMQQHPQGFKGAQAEAQQAKQAMTSAAESLENKSTDAPAATQQAEQQLAQCSNAMRSQSLEHQLADAYQLKKMLDQQAAALNQSGSPGAAASDESLGQTASEARETVNQLKKIAEQEPTRDVFGQPLRDALSGDHKVNLDVKLSQLERPRRLDEVLDGATRQQTASDAAKALADVSKAFEQSQPGALRMAQRSDALQPDSQDSFNQGMAELDSLIKQLQDHRSISPQDLQKQGREAIHNLQAAMSSPSGKNERLDRMLVELDRILKAETIDLGDLRKLLDELQSFSAEVSDRLAAKPNEPEATNIDPSKLPPAYRGRIQKYFQKLSEK